MINKLNLYIYVDNFNNRGCYITHFQEKSQTGRLSYFNETKLHTYNRKTIGGKFYLLAVLVLATSYTFGGLTMARK